MRNWEKYLKRIYFDPAHPGSFQSPLRLYHIVKKEGKYKISHKQIKKWIQKQESYSQNKTVKRHFQRGRVIVKGIDDQFDADLALFSSYSDENDGYKYLLFVIDIFSRYGWVEPIKDKSAKEVIPAFNKILDEGRIPRRLRTDAGKEFTNNLFQNNLNERDIVHFTTHSEKQANYVERFIKTIKSRLYRYMIENNTSRYIDILPKIVDSYNKTWHTGIRSEPINVTKANENLLWWQMYWPKTKYIKTRQKRKRDLYSFKVNDKVRISNIQTPFQREYDTKWSAEIFKIQQRFIRQGQPIYKIVDWDNNPVQGTFYQKELQKVDVSDENLFKVDIILKYRGRGKNKEALVKWKGWPKKFNSWIPASDLITYSPKK